jgi:hypothetical protein
VDIKKIIAELSAERSRLDQAIAALQGVNSSTGRSNSNKSVTTQRGWRRMSAAARKRLSVLMKKRWAAGKMGRRKAKAA